MLKVTLPDGTSKQYEQSLTPGDIAAEIGPGLAKAALAAKVDDAIVGLDYQLAPDDEVALRLLTKKDSESLAVMRHSCSTYSSENGSCSASSHAWLKSQPTLTHRWPGIVSS